jgi:hypothetical protein
LVTNMVLVAEACYWYQKRFRIETFFFCQLPPVIGHP